MGPAKPLKRFHNRIKDELIRRFVTGCDRYLFPPQNPTKICPIDQKYSPTKPSLESNQNGFTGCWIYVVAVVEIYGNGRTVACVS